jgi:hypothetical protein
LIDVAISIPPARTLLRKHFLVCLDVRMPARFQKKSAGCRKASDSQHHTNIGRMVK